MCPQAVKAPFPKPFISWENSPFQGKEKAIFKGTLSLGKVFPLRQFSLAGKMLPQKSGKKRAHKLKKNPRDTRRVYLGHPAGQTAVYRPVSQGIPVIYFRKKDREGHFCRDTGRVSQGHPAIQGASEILCGFSYVPFLLPKKMFREVTQKLRFLGARFDSRPASVIEFFRVSPRGGDNFTSLFHVLKTLYSKHQKHPFSP